MPTSDQTYLCQVHAKQQVHQVMPLSSPLNSTAWGLPDLLGVVVSPSARGVLSPLRSLGTSPMPSIGQRGEGTPQSCWGLHSPEKIMRRGRVRWLCLGRMDPWCARPSSTGTSGQETTKKPHWQREHSPDFTSSSASQVSESLLPGSVEV